MMPTPALLRAIANEIARQFPSLDDVADDGPGAGGDRVLRLTAAQIATVSHALGLATSVLLEARAPSPAARGWTAIIDAALMARGAPGIDGDTLGALARVEPETLERMARLVLGPSPAGGEARAALDEVDVMRADAAERELARVEAELNALVEWASPLSRDMGAIGGLRTIRRTMEDERATNAEAESLVERLDEALCTLLHDGGELGEHSPETHLAMFRARLHVEAFEVLPTLATAEAERLDEVARGFGFVDHASMRRLLAARGLDLVSLSTPEPVRDAERALLAACRAALIVTSAPDDFLAPASEHDIRKAIEALRLAERGLGPDGLERDPGMPGPEDMSPEDMSPGPFAAARVIGVDPAGRDTRLDGLTDEQIGAALAESEALDAALDDDD